MGIRRGAVSWKESTPPQPQRSGTFHESFEHVDEHHHEDQGGDLEWYNKTMKMMEMLSVMKLVGKIPENFRNGEEAFHAVQGR